MKKNLLIFALIITNVFISFSQVTTCDLVIKENQELKQQNDYLRKSLRIFEPIKSVEKDDIEFKLVKCEGNIKQQSITVTLILINHNANHTFQLDISQIVDIQGNDFTSYSVFLGKNSSRNTLYTDTPLQSKIIFDKVLPSTKILKVLNVNYFPWDGGWNSKGLEFKDIEVNWK